MTDVRRAQLEQERTLLIVRLSWYHESEPADRPMRAALLWKLRALERDIKQLKASE